GHQPRVDGDRLSRCTFDVVAELLEERDVLEGAAAVQPVDECRGRGITTVRLARVDLAEPNEPVRLRVGQRTQQHAIDDAEDRRGSADAEAERYDGHEREPLRP